MEKYCLVNKSFIPEKEAKISINERGFLFGDGVFETCRIINGKIYNFLSHKNRLESGLKAIKIDFDLSSLEKNILKLIAKNNLKNGLARIYISRGQGSNGYAPQPNIKPLIVIQTKKLPKIPKKPIKLCISKITKISSNSLPINYKLAANGLNSTLAKLEAQENGYFDAILLNEKGEICETSAANIFWVKNNILHTPDKYCGILLGTIRQKIINNSPIKVKEVKAQMSELVNSEEIFISNISYPILEISSVEKNKLSGISRKITSHFREFFRKEFEEV